MVVVDRIEYDGTVEDNVDRYLGYGEARGPWFNA
jgi:hypothetical protein